MITVQRRKYGSVVYAAEFLSFLLGIIVSIAENYPEASNNLMKKIIINVKGQSIIERRVILHFESSAIFR